MFFFKSLRLFQRLSILHSTLLCRLDCLSARYQARIESYNQMTELIDLAEKEVLFIAK